MLTAACGHRWSVIDAGHGMSAFTRCEHPQRQEAQLFASTHPHQRQHQRAAPRPPRKNPACPTIGNCPPLRRRRLLLAQGLLRPLCDILAEPIDDRLAGRRVDLLDGFSE